MGMELIPFIALIVLAAVVGLGAQLLGHPRSGFDWAMTGVAAFIGGYIASELLGAASTIGPEWGGLYYVPALIGALFVGVAVELIVRRTGQTAAA